MAARDLLSGHRLVLILAGVAAAGLCGPVRAADVPFGPQQLIVDLPPAYGDGAISVFAADVDGDGDIDVLSATFWDDKVAWYENTDGAGTFGPQQVITTAARRAWSVFAADVDGDGDIDVLSASLGDDKIAWYENLLRDRCVRSDFDCDGDVDLGDYHSFVSCFTGPGVPPSGGCHLADLDRDGDVDLGDLVTFQAAFTGSE